MRLFASRGMELLVAQSYSKNLGLYAERIGAINVVCSSADAATRFDDLTYNSCLILFQSIRGPAERMYCREM